jgi:hypothetical protein
MGNVEIVAFDGTGPAASRKREGDDAVRSFK